MTCFDDDLRSNQADIDAGRLVPRQRAADGRLWMERCRRPVVRSAATALDARA